MLARQMPAFAGYGESAILADHRYQISHHERIDRRQLDRGTRKRECAQARDLVRRRRGRFCQRAIRQPADIAVAVQLAPGKTFAIAVIDGHALAFQRLGQKRGIEGRRLAQRRERLGNFKFLATDKTRRRDLAFEIFRGEIGPRRRQARIIHSVGPAICRSRARPGIRRLPGAPVLPMASSRRCRHAASFSRVRRNAAGTARR